MTKRRSIIALFLAVAILALGVGYAALTDDLTAKGELGTPQFASLVSYDTTTYKVSGVSNGATVSDFKTAEKAITVAFSDGTDPTNDADDVATVNINNGQLMAAGDYVEVQLTIKNTSTIAATLSAVVSETDAGNHFTVSDVTFSSTNLAASSGTATATFRVTLDTVPSGSASGSFNITITATAAN